MLSLFTEFQIWPTGIKEFLGKETTLFKAELAAVCRAYKLLSNVKDINIVINFDYR